MARVTQISNGTPRVFVKQIRFYAILLCRAIQSIDSMFNHWCMLCLGMAAHTCVMKVACDRLNMAHSPDAAESA